MAPSGASQVFRRFAAARGMRIMNSTLYPDSSWEDPKLEHGRFSYYVLKGLQGDPDATDAETGLITFASLYNYVKEHVQLEDDKNPRQPQEFYEGGEHTNDVYIASTRKVRAAQL